MTRKILSLSLFIAILIIIINYKILLRHYFPTNYNKIVNKYATEYKLDPNLIYALIKVESKFDPLAKSHKGALGLMQITPQTGRYISELLGDKNFNEEKLYDPQVNIKYGCFYVSKLLKDFNNNLDCLLGAYNGGEGNVRKWIKNGGNGEKILKVKDVPFEETKTYINKVKIIYKIYTFLYSN